jgi:hypothetical protein
MRPWCLRTWDVLVCGFGTLQESPERHVATVPGKVTLVAATRAFWGLIPVLSAQLSKSTASSRHPYHKFGTGNWVTLWDTPGSLGLDLRAQLLKFHETYYSANVMTLCIMGKYGLWSLFPEWVGCR